MAILGKKKHGTYFNPHEREARDRDGRLVLPLYDAILIHTSVKLVTLSLRPLR